jgi:hypothetical protein
MAPTTSSSSPRRWCVCVRCWCGWERRWFVVGVALVPLLYTPWRARPCVAIMARLDTQAAPLMAQTLRRWRSG